MIELAKKNARMGAGVFIKGRLFGVRKLAFGYGSFNECLQSQESLHPRPIHNAGPVLLLLHCHNVLTDYLAQQFNFVRSQNDGYHFRRVEGGAVALSLGCVVHGGLDVGREGGVQ